MFSGKSKEDVNTWIFVVENAMKLVNIPKDKEILAIGPYLSRHAFGLYKRMVEEEDDADWNGFKKTLRVNFASANKDLDIRSAMRALKQETTISNYMDEFFELSASVSNMSDAELLSNYLCGLKPNIETLIRSKGPQTFADALRASPTSLPKCFLNTSS
jgi:hypothetical protein